METIAVDPPRSPWAAPLLGVPSHGFIPLNSDEDDCEAGMGIRPKSSPLPRRKSSSSEDESEGAMWGTPPAPGTRRVSFADARGLSLVLVKEFDARDFPKPRGYCERQEEGPDAERGFSYVLSPLSPLAGSPEELGCRVRQQKIELESVELLPGTTVLRGVVRVLNISFHKTVFVRTTLDAWASHFDLLTEHIPGSSDGETDCFSFKLTLIPPFEEQGARVDFCLRYETPVGTFWANNCGKNYVLICQQRVKEVAETREECAIRKSCLKAARGHFTTVDNPSSESNVESEEKRITGVLKKEGVLTVVSGQVTDSLNSSAEEERPKLLMESSQKIANRRNRRRAARQAKVKERDLSFPKDPKAESVITKEASLLGPPSDSTMQGRNSYSAQVKGNREVTETGAIQANPEQKQPSAACITGVDWPRRLESMGQSDGRRDDVCIANNTREESHSDVCLTENTEVPVTASDGFTFGTVLAPLYPLVCGQLMGENPELADQSKSGRELSRMGDILESSSLTDLTEKDEDPLKSHVQNSMSPHLKDASIEGGVCVSVAADRSPNPADASGQKSQHGCTGTHTNNPQPTTDEDTRPSDLNDEVLNDASTTRAGLDHQGNPVKGPLALGRQLTNLYEMQIQEEATMAKTEAGEAIYDNQMRLNTTQALSQAKIVQETTHATSQPPCSPLVLACENQATDSEIRSEEAPDLICTDMLGEQPGVPPTTTVSTTHSYLEQGREREQLEDLDVDCLMVPSRFVAAGISVRDQSIPELEDGQECSAPNLSQETNETSMEVVEEPHIGSNDSTNDLEEVDTTPTVEHEQSVDVSERIRVNMTSCTHPDMLAKESLVTLVEKLVCVQAEAEERSTSETVATEQDFFGRREERTEEINWETMVEEDEKDVLGGEVMRKEKAQKGQEEVLKDEQIKTELPPLENIVRYERREHKETNSKGQNCFNLTKDKSEVQFESSVEETFRGEKGEDKKRERDADHSADNQHDVWETVRYREEGIPAETDQETQEQVADNAERTSVDEEVDGAGEEMVPVETVESSTQRPEMGSQPGQNKVEGVPSAPTSNVHEYEVERVIDEQDSPENETACFPTEMQFISEEEVLSNTYRLQRTNGQSEALSESARHGSDSRAKETGSRILTEEPDCDEADEGESSSSESLSDEEMELYMYCLRAAPSPQTLRSSTRDGGAMTGSQRGKRPLIDRPRFLPLSMPPISESVNEDQLTRTPGSPEEMTVENFQDDCRQFPPQHNQGNGRFNIAQWKSAFSCRNILKSLLYITMLVVFLVVGYHYDFLACFALYLLSICWLYCRSDSHSVQNNKDLT